MRNGELEFSHKKLWILFGILFLAIVVLIFTIVFILKSFDFGINSEKENSSFLSEYLVELDEAVDQASTEEYKGELYSNCAGRLYDRQLEGGGDYISVIFDCAYKAESINPTAFTAYNLYIYEKEFGDSIKSNEYLEKAKERGIDGAEIAV